MQLMAVLLLGEEIALVALVVLLVVIVLAVWLCVWLVKRFRTQLGRRAYLLPLGGGHCPCGTLLCAFLARPTQ